jgi:hypothetical protein
MKVDLRISIKDYPRRENLESSNFPVPLVERCSANRWSNQAKVLQCRHASVWRELVAFRAGAMQPGAGDTSSRQTEADATAFP